MPEPQIAGTPKERKAQYDRIYREQNKDRLRTRRRSAREKWTEKERVREKARVKLWLKNNKARQQRKWAEYRVRNLAKIKRQASDYQRRNAHGIRDYKAAWYLKNKERLSIKAGAAYRSNPIAAKQRARLRYCEKPEAIKAKVKEWRRSPNGKICHRAINHRRRCWVANSTSPPTGRQLRVLLGSVTACYYCDKPFTASNPATLDHMTPRCRDGAHSMENLCVACRSCNSRKSRKTAEEFFEMLHAAGVGCAGADPVGGCPIAAA